VGTGPTLPLTHGLFHPLTAEKFIKTLPTWVIQLWKKEVSFTKEDIVEHTRADEGVLFCHFPVSVLGTDPKKGGVTLTHSAQPGPRWRHLSREVHGPVHSPKLKCHVEGGYVYSYSFLPKC
jgi:hypothetical protein